MDKEQVIARVEGEIMRREALVKMGEFFAEDHRQMAVALREMLEAYQTPPKFQTPPFRSHNILVVRGSREARRRR